jgi:chaperonin GroES
MGANFSNSFGIIGFCFILYIIFNSFLMSLSHDMIERLTPLSDRVLLKPVEAEKITASGIIIPDSPNKERPSLYEVIAVGPGRTDKEWVFQKIDLQKGDRVISGQYSGDDVKIGDVTYKIVAAEYVLAKVS